MRHLARLVLLSSAFLLATVVGGWAAVPVVGAVWGVLARTFRAPARDAAVAGAIAWSALLLWAGAHGDVVGLAGRLAPLFRVPGAVLLIASILFATGLAWSATAVATFGARAVNRRNAP